MFRKATKVIQGSGFFYRNAIKLTHISIAYFLWDISKQCSSRSDAANAASDQDLHCLLTECSVKI